MKAPILQPWPDPPLPPALYGVWEGFFKEQHHKEKQGPAVYDSIYQLDVFPLQYKRELLAMLTVAASKKPKTVMEIGCDKCGGLYHWCQLPSVRNVIGCEIRGTPYAPMFEKNFPDIDFCWTDNSRTPESLRTVSEFLARQGVLIDVLFLDGDKCFYTEDFDAYRPMISETGLVFMHDVTEGYPKQVFEKMGRERGCRTELIRDVTEYHNLSFDNTPSSSYEQWLRAWKGTSCGVGIVHMS